ncbi:MAG TPA: PDZ domain-containing protein [Agriterribacter sp.]|nr:PDZ domain-containing protein [Agriterribacter sp.]
MKKAFLRCSLLTAAISGYILLSIPVAAQEVENKKKEEIIIQKKKDKDEKMTIVIDGDKITVNGEPLSDFKDEDVIIRKRNLAISPDKGNRGSRDFMAPPSPYAPLPPMPPHVWRFSDDDAITLFAPRAMLGVFTEKDGKGAKINEVMDSSAAQKAGLAKGDIITKVGDKEITDPPSLSAAIRDQKPGDEIQVEFIRANKQMKAKVKLGESKSSARTFNFDMAPFNEDATREFKFHGPNWEGNWDLFTEKPQLGIRIQDVEEGNGVKVLDVEESSTAEKAGIKKDDLIIAIDGTVIKNAGDAKKKVVELKDKSSYPVKLKRKGAMITVNVKVPKKLKSADL